MSRITRYTAVGLASFGLLGGSLIATAPAYADHRGDRSRSDYKEVEGKDCLKSDHDRECKSKTWLDVDEWKFRGKSGWRAVKLSADVDFFQKKSDDRRKDDWNKRDGDQSWNNKDDSNKGDHNQDWNKDDHSWKDGNGHNHDDLGEVKFQFWDDHRDEWKTFATEDVDRDGEADVKVKIKIKRHDEVKLRAEYRGVHDQIEGSTSNRVEID